MSEGTGRELLAVNTAQHDTAQDRIAGSVYSYTLLWTKQSGDVLGDCVQRSTLLKQV
jgi:hypothetical protein